ncbi:Uncharacterised protein [Mycobacteroides abscessus subsp. abscessus]|nr:Uncharacterised protein [Mycobacteroides abscessus subsp. abscessus]
MFGENQGPRVFVVVGGLQHHGHAVAPAMGNRDHIAAPEGRQGVVGRTPALKPGRPRRGALPLGEASPQPDILQHRAIVSIEFTGDLVKHLPAALDTAHQTHHRAIGLVLGEGSLQQLSRRGRTHAVHQVDRHVVRRRKRTAQRKGTCGRQAGYLGGLNLGCPQHDSVSLDVNSTAARPAGQLGVLPRRQRGVLLTVELDQSLQHDRARRHVDSQSQCLGGEYRLHQPLGEQFLDGVPEHRKHARMVRGNATQQPLAPLPVAEYIEIGLGQPLGTPVDDGDDLTPFLFGGQP